MQSVSKISYNELPFDVQKRINVVLKHRKSINKFSMQFGVLFGGVAAYEANRNGLFSGRPLIETAGRMVPSVAGISAVGLIALKEHESTYKKDDINLWRAIRGSSNPKIRALCEGHPYVVVDIKGGLVGKKISPKIGFIPFGRRRLSTRKAPLRIGFRKVKLKS